MTRRRQAEARRRALSQESHGEARNDPPATTEPPEAVAAVSEPRLDGLAELEREVADLEAELAAESQPVTPTWPHRPLVEQLREAAGLPVDY